MDNNDRIGEENIAKVLKKTRRSFNLRILKVLAVIAAAVWLVYMIPLALWGVQSLHQVKASRVLMDIMQFSQPDKVNSWGNGSMKMFSLNMPLVTSAITQTGKKFDNQKNFTVKMSLITGRVAAPVVLGAQFAHPDLFRDMLPEWRQSPDAQSAILEKNAETTVATADFSLHGFISLEDAAALLGEYDVDICWLAAEAGIESLEPRNMTFQNQQALQWGIPGKLSRPREFDYAALKKNNADEYEKAVLDEMKWLDDNKGLLTPDTGLLRDNGINNSVGDKAAYILRNGIKIYGLRITGPTSELLKLKEKLEPRLMSVVNMDFWNW